MATFVEQYLSVFPYQPSDGSEDMKCNIFALIKVLFNFVGDNFGKAIAFLLVVLHFGLIIAASHQNFIKHEYNGRRAWL